MSDLQAQARAEAERRWPGKMALAPIMKARFLDGVEWADANHPAVEALARVRALHRPVESQWGDQACAECLNSWELEVVWPCATYQATEVDA